jgi:uncharacterized protein YacL
MEKWISKETISALLKLGVYQIVGGAIGALLILWAILHTSEFNTTLILISVFILALFGYSIFCGISCIQTRRNALMHSLLNQALQVLSFAIPGFAFSYTAGVSVSVGMVMTDTLEFDFGAGISSVIVNTNTEQEHLKLGFNLVAIFLILWINKLMKTAKEELKRWNMPATDNA